MINKNDLKDWLKEADRKRAIAKIEEVLDSAIKRNALAGKYDFMVSTGRYTRDGSEKTDFYNIWYNQELSDENQNIVQATVIKKYKDAGFDIAIGSHDCGWSNFYRCVKFKNINKLIEETAND